MTNTLDKVITLSDDETNEADQMLASLKSTDDPYALTRVIEHFIRTRLQGQRMEGWAAPHWDGYIFAESISLADETEGAVPAILILKP